MRAILFLALLAPIMAFDVQINHSPALSHLQTKQAKIMEDQIIAFLECIRDILNNGDAETGLPSFNPLEIDELNVDLDSLNLQGISGHVNVKNFHLAGISHWDLKQLKISVTIIPVGAKIVVKVSWPAGDVSGTYDADASIFDHTFVGSGNIAGDLSELSFELEGQAVLNPISIKSAKLKVSLGSSALLIENLAIDGQDVSGPLQEFAANLPQYLKDNAALIDQLLKDVVIPAINALLDAILNGGDGRMLENDIPIIGKCLSSKRV